MPTPLDPNAECVFIDGSPDDYPKMVDDEYITLEGGPYGSEEECAEGGPPCGCANGAPSLTVSLAWDEADNPAKCLPFLGLVWLNGEPKELCPDRYEVTDCSSVVDGFGTKYYAAGEIFTVAGSGQKIRMTVASGGTATITNWSGLCNVQTLGGYANGVTSAGAPAYYQGQMFGGACGMCFQNSSGNTQQATSIWDSVNVSFVGRVSRINGIGGSVHYDASTAHELKGVTVSWSGLNRV